MPGFFEGLPLLDWFYCKIRVFRLYVGFSDFATEFLDFGLFRFWHSVIWSPLVNQKSASWKSLEKRITVCSSSDLPNPELRPIDIKITKIWCIIFLKITDEQWDKYTKIVWYLEKSTKAKLYREIVGINWKWRNLG